MKIALITNGVFPFSIGGIQKHSFFLAKYFAKKKVIVDVYYSTLETNSEIKLIDYFDDSELDFIKFKVIEFPKVKSFPGHYIYSSYMFSKKLYSEIDITNYDHIYAQGFTSWYFLKKNPFDQKIISNLHGLEMFQYSINLKNKIEQKLLSIPAKAIIKKSFKQVSLGGKLTDILKNKRAKSNSIFEIPNGIDSSWILDNDVCLNKKMNFVFVGRYERRKGIEEFHEVIKDTIDDFGYSVHFIGPIPTDKQIHHKDVTYYGSIQDSNKIKKLLVKSDVLVCPSYSEGMPTVILEAMASGCAILATDVGAVSTMVSKDNGWLISNNNLSTNLHEALIDTFSIGKEELVSKKKNSIKLVRQSFLWDTIVNKTIECMSV